MHVLDLGWTEGGTPRRWPSGSGTESNPIKGVITPMDAIDFLARLVAAVIAWVRCLNAPTRTSAAGALVATGALLAY
jgi:hypothetical protein